MGLGISLHTGATPIGDTLRVTLERAHEAAQAGVDTIWFSQGLDIDAITVSALVGREIPGISIGTAAVPMYPRHPLVTAAQARTAQIATDGRFLLGIGLGNRALRAAGELADGTLPYLAGPRTLAASIVPTIVEAARAAGRPAPIVAASVPAAVTADIAASRAHAERTLAPYGTVPSYRAVLDAEGAVHPADVALIGDEDTVAAGIQQYLDAGATDVRISPAAFRTDDDRLRTWRLVGELTRGARSARTAAGADTP